MTSPTGTAYAKLNLALHVVGRRDDGYHLLDSLVVFAALGDRLTVTPADGLHLTVSGPFASGVPIDDRNLVLRAAALMGVTDGVAIHLEKALPHAAGIGGGSSDAATTLRLLSDHTATPLPDMAQVLTLGADVPVCLRGRPTRMRGIGDDLTDVPPLPKLWVVLVNPGVPVPTGPVFKALARADNPPLPETDWTANNPSSLIDWLGRTRNDLEPPARALVPAIGTVIDRLNGAPGCALARMSGSGGTCFGLFTSADAASDAARIIAAAEPIWWVAATDIVREGSV